MQIIQKENKRIYHFPLDMYDVLETHRVELPARIIMETCQSAFEQEKTSISNDGEIVVMNFLEGGISIVVEIVGTRNNTLKSQRIQLNPKQNDASYGWQYSSSNDIEVSVAAHLLTGQEIPLLENEKIPINTRFKQLLFYS